MKFGEITTLGFEIVSKIWLILSITGFCVDRWTNIRGLFNRFMKKPVDYTLVHSLELF